VNGVGSHLLSHYELMAKAEVKVITWNETQIQQFEPQIKKTVSGMASSNFFSKDEV
jgi:hypothetical protein